MPKTNTSYFVQIVSVLLAGLLSASWATRAAQASGAQTCEARTTSKQPKILEADQFHGSLFGMDYEPWFTSKNVTWDTAEAVPVLGKYSSYDVSIIKKHAEWFEYLGINWVLLDWSNMLWMNPPWEAQTGAVRQLEESTRLLFDTYNQLEQEGKHPPKIVLLLALQNGPPVKNGVERLREIFRWLDAHFLSDPRYKDLWLYYHGKPLIVLWYSPYDACQRLAVLLKKHPLDEPQWTIRWLNQQLQVTHAENCGMWSWIDGTIRQEVIYRNGKPEETVVTPSCFPPGGWLASDAVGRDHGAPYLTSWKIAFETRPKFITIHQWNEFLGEKEGHGYGPQHHIYLDEYNVPLSDDLEPTRFDACAYRGCGGWGYYYMNLTKALISLYRGQTPGITVMALAGPAEPNVVTKRKLPLHWTTLGALPTSYSLQVDGKIFVRGIHKDRYTLDLSRIEPGTHRVTLVANGVYTCFDLDPEKLTRQSRRALPVTSTIEFKYAPKQDESNQFTR